MYKYAIFAILISFTLCACQKKQQPDSTLDAIAEPTSTIAETAAPKETGAYEDRTAVIPDSTKRLVENPIFVFSLIPDADSRLGVSLDELYQNSVSVVRGTITDHTYQSRGMISCFFPTVFRRRISPEHIIQLHPVTEENLSETKTVCTKNPCPI